MASFATTSITFIIFASGVFGFDLKTNCRWDYYDTKWIFDPKNMFTNSRPRIASAFGAVKSKIGSGSYGEVKQVEIMVTSSKYKKFAVKRIPIPRIKRIELDILVELSGKNVAPNFYACARDESNIYLVQDRLPESLEKPLNMEFIKTLDEKTAFLFFKTLFDALFALFNNGFIHHDVKPGNLMTDSTFRRIFLIDFGVSQVKMDENNKIGTPIYMSCNRHYGEVNSRMSDLYAAALSIGTIYGGYDKIFTKLSVTNPLYAKGEIPDECFYLKKSPRLWIFTLEEQRNFCVDNLKTNVINAVKGKFGPYQENSSFEQANFTTLLGWLVDYERNKLQPNQAYQILERLGQQYTEEERKALEKQQQKKDLEALNDQKLKLKIAELHAEQAEHEKEIREEEKKLEARIRAKRIEDALNKLKLLRGEDEEDGLRHSRIYQDNAQACERIKGEVVPGEVDKEFVEENIPEPDKKRLMGALSQEKIDWHPKEIEGVARKLNVPQNQLNNPKEQVPVQKSFQKKPNPFVDVLNPNELKERIRNSSSKMLKPGQYQPVGRNSVEKKVIPPPQQQNKVQAKVEENQYQPIARKSVEKKVIPPPQQQNKVQANVEEKPRLNLGQNKLNQMAANLGKQMNQLLNQNPGNQNKHFNVENKLQDVVQEEKQKERVQEPLVKIEEPIEEVRELPIHSRFAVNQNPAEIIVAANKLPKVQNKQHEEQSEALFGNPTVSKLVFAPSEDNKIPEEPSHFIINKIKYLSNNKSQEKLPELPVILKNERSAAKENRLEEKRPQVNVQAQGGRGEERVHFYVDLNNNYHRFKPNSEVSDKLVLQSQRVREDERNVPQRYNNNLQEYDPRPYQRNPGANSYNRAASYDNHNRRIFNKSSEEQSSKEVERQERSVDRKYDVDLPLPKVDLAANHPLGGERHNQDPHVDTRQLNREYYNKATKYLEEYKAQDNKGYSSRRPLYDPKNLPRNKSVNHLI